jgi:hypothetical protein
LLGGTAIILLVGALLRDQQPRLAWDARGIPACAANAAENLLAVRSLQCWFDAAHGRWRTVSHVSVYGAIVIQIEAAELLDAEEIARRFVADCGDRFLEILVYVRKDLEEAPRAVRRVQWTRREGVQTLDFTGPVVD